MLQRHPLSTAANQLAELFLQRGGEIGGELKVEFQAFHTEEMTQKAGGRRTVPQIWINGTHVGGSDDLYALEREGKLDPMLTA